MEITQTKGKVMPISTDYWISAVRFNSAHTHIDMVRAHANQNNSIGVEQTVSRQEVIRLIKSGLIYYTIFKNRDGSWDVGQKVERVTIDNVEYIKTLADRIKADNLDNLPEF